MEYCDKDGSCSEGLYKRGKRVWEEIGKQAYLYAGPERLVRVGMGGFQAGKSSISHSPNLCTICPILIMFLPYTNTYLPRITL